MIEAKQIINWFKENETLTWRDIIYKIVKENNIDPWDVDVSLLSKEYLNMIRTLKELDFQLSGDIILTAAILLKYKSKNLIESKLKNFETLFQTDDEDFSIPEFFPEAFDFTNDSFEEGAFVLPSKQNTNFGIVLKPRIPQARRRKVYLNDLIEALENALSVKKKHYSVNLKNKSTKIYEKKSLFDIRELMTQVLNRVKSIVNKVGDHVLKFSDIFDVNDTMMDKNNKIEKIKTFIALLHLDFHQKIEISQKENFGEIFIKVKD